jgi:hypothetical protein
VNGIFYHLVGKKSEGMEGGVGGSSPPRPTLSNPSMNWRKKGSKNGAWESYNLTPYFPTSNIIFTFFSPSPNLNMKNQ